MSAADRNRIVRAAEIGSIALLVLGFISAYLGLAHAHDGASPGIVRTMAVPIAYIAIAAGAALQLIAGRART